MFFLIVLWTSITSSSADAPATRKRGFSGFVGKYTCEDATALGLGDSWWYNWITNPSQYGKCHGKKQAAEFVPMVVGINQAQHFTDAVKRRWEETNVHYLLGYNEPDSGNGKHNHPHECSPASAAADWPSLQKIAEQFDPPLQLVAPGVASRGETGGGDAWDDDGKSTWLDDFFGNCTHVVKDCNITKIKYIAMHDYHGNVTGLKRRVEGAAKRYGRKVWLTEFAITRFGNAPARAEQDSYLKEVLPYLDSSEAVFRYVWFTARNVPNRQNGGSNLLPSDSLSMIPTSTGEIYASKSDTVIV